MALPFPAITDARTDGKSKVSQQLLRDYRDRDESLGSCLVDTFFTEVNTNNTSFAEVHRHSIWLPPVAGTTVKTPSFVLGFRAYMQDAGAVGRVRAKLGTSGTYVESGDITDTSYGNPIELSLPAADCRTNAGQTADLIIEAKRASGTGQIRLKSEDSISRLEIS